MDPFHAGKKWGESVTGLAQKKLLSWADGKETVSDFKRAMIEAERDLPESCDPFRVEVSSVDGGWIRRFCEGVRAAKSRVESGWR